MKITNTKSLTPLLRSTFYVLFALPMVASATDQSITTVIQLLGKIREIIDAVVPFIVGLAVFVVIWGIFTYLTHAGEEEKRTQARQFILWGVIGVFFMLSVWGFVNILLNTFNLDRNLTEDKIPHVPQISAGRDGVVSGCPEGQTKGTDGKCQ